MIVEITYLHSTMVLFKCVKGIEKITCEYEFTFHYGSIQIQSVYTLLKDFKIYIPLWFYSNGLMSLSCRGLINAFTFHYGSIQMITLKMAFHLSEIFTFHYGSIQIRTTTQPQPLVQIYIPLWFYSNCITNVRAKLLFLDLHSTMVLFKLFCTLSYYVLTSIYIPLWFYSNVKILHIIAI